jgi:hypothetical protein
MQQHDRIPIIFYLEMEGEKDDEHPDVDMGEK